MPTAITPHSAVDAVDGDRADRIVDAALVDEQHDLDDEDRGDRADDRGRPRLTNAHGAVIATRPASMPLPNIAGVGLSERFMT